MSETILSVENLRVEFETRRGTLVALDDISFSIAKGEVLGVVGESGAGKSMTGAALMHLIPRPGRIAGGRVLLGDQRIDNLDRTGIEAIRGRRIGMIFQDPLTSLNPLMTVGDHLTETIRVHLPLNRPQARARAIELLEEVGIPDPAVRIDSYPHEFSGGQRQRVVIALALCAEPELVIADEPTTALDVSVQAQIIKLIRKLCSTRGTAFMLITHDMGMIAETADRVAVMYAGKVAEIGKVSQVVGAPLHPYAQGLMGAIPSLDNEEPRLRQIPGSMPSLTALPGGCSFHPRCERAMDICRQRAPALLGAIDHKVACHLYEREEVAA
ncbi:ABC transporter ATP-binding protein [Shinella sumterensis]|uniref:ABC transporter ATP-binding protein n=1 Tax=Shinella sumterensis TaxID=1967501 RepID=UPI003F85A765